MVRMVARKKMTYGTRAIKAGESFDADSPHDARLLETIGHASRETEGDEQGKKRAYKRRDMQAER